MSEELSFIMESTEDSMKKAINHLEAELLKIRAGKASPQMLDGIMVDYYGSATPLNQVANVSAIDARTITVQPWEKNMLQPIERAIINSNIGINPQNDGILINFSNAGTGLWAKNKYGYVLGFEIAGEDQVFHFAQAVIRGNQLFVFSEQVKQPVAVRYAWADDPADANLYNKEGFPASPFRTDNWKMKTASAKYSIR